METLKSFIYMIFSLIIWSFGGWVPFFLIVTACTVAQYWSRYEKRKRKEEIRELNRLKRELSNGK